MIQAFSLAIAQLGDRNFRRPLVLGLSGAALVFVALWIGLWLLLTRTHLFAIGWLDTVVAALGELAAIGLAFILYPALPPSLIALFPHHLVHPAQPRHHPPTPP